MAEVSKATRQTIAQNAKALMAAQTALDDALNRASLDSTAERLLMPLDVVGQSLGDAQEAVSRRHRNSPAITTARKALNDLLVSIGVSPEAWAQVWTEAMNRAKQAAKRSGS